MSDLTLSTTGIVWYPAEVLRKVALPITEFNDRLRVFVNDLSETMMSNNGLGLAAPQLGKSIRVFVMKMRMGKDRPPKVLVVCNPVLEVSGPEEADIEGCLSMPGVREQVWRKSKVFMTYDDPQKDGSVERKEIYLEGLEARIAQHENDHLDGIMYFDRLATRQLKKQLLKNYEKSRQRALLHVR